MKIRIVIVDQVLEAAHGLSSIEQEVHVRPVFHDLPFDTFLNHCKIAVTDNFPHFVLLYNGRGCRISISINYRRKNEEHKTAN